MEIEKLRLEFNTILEATTALQQEAKRQKLDTWFPHLHHLHQNPWDESKIQSPIHYLEAACSSVRRRPKSVPPYSHSHAMVTILSIVFTFCIRHWTSWSVIYRTKYCGTPKCFSTKTTGESSWQRRCRRQGAVEKKIASYNPKICTRRWQ